MLFHGPDLKRDQSGFSALLIVTALLGASLLGLKYMQHRTELELRAEAHQDWIVDKLKVKSSLRSQSDCQLINLNSGCTIGNTIALPKQSGGILVAANGSTKIGRWNVKVECLAKTPPAYGVLVGSPAGGNGFHKDPLTQKPLVWTKLMSLTEACGSTGAATLLAKSAPCYGAQQGVEPLPPEVTAQTGCTGSCLFAGHYCGDAQRDFPSCPPDYQSTFRYVDRYGWGGIDMTKYTICTKL
jgi:hypothetical protein